MIYFFYDKKAMRKRLRNLLKVLMGEWLVLGLIALIILLYCLPAAIFKDKDSIINASIMLAFLVVVACLMWKVFSPFYIAITSAFKKHAKDGLMRYSLFVRDSKFVRKCLESEEEFEFAKEDIKEIKREKSIIVVRLHSNYIVDFPNRDDIYELLK